VEAGEFRQEGRGRKAVLTSTRRSDRRFEAETEFLKLGFRQDAGLAPWEGRWHLVTFSIEEGQRSARNDLRAALTWTGAVLSGGSYVSVHPWEDRISRLADHLGVRDRVVFADADRLVVGGTDDPRRVAASLWALDEIGQRWQRFLDDAIARVGDFEGAAVGSADERIAFMAQTVNVSNAFESCLRNDPLLPPELLPEDWPGRRARQWILDTSDGFSRFRGALQVWV
jgi:phenylacetic acid degradation operon negative regulatory protein